MQRFRTIKLTWIAAVAVIGFAQIALAQAPLAQAPAGTSSAGQTQPGNVNLYARKIAGGAADVSIRSAAARNDPKRPSLGPPPKVDYGKPARKADQVCLIHVDNRTTWATDLYFNGDYGATVSGWGDSYVPASEPATFYAKAEMTDGSALTWGPIRAQCNGFEYMVHLWP
ncbi:MAG: hypothetical protein WA005_00245 [Candidatus Binataceae bacterium]